MKKLTSTSGPFEWAEYGSSWRCDLGNGRLLVVESFGRSAHFPVVISGETADEYREYRTYLGAMHRAEREARKRGWV
jgi:hypothetical protein